jgi:hypothetical protein
MTPAFEMAMRTKNKAVMGGGTAPRITPWGWADSVTTIGRGVQRIYFCSTPSHGGYYVPDSMLESVRPEGQKYAQHWSGDKHWFEEDCAWCFVAEAFPNLFPAEAIERAKSLVQYIIPNRLP